MRMIEFWPPLSSEFEISAWMVCQSPADGMPVYGDYFKAILPPTQ